MKDITVICDRCGKLVDGTIDKDKNGCIITGGYYIVDKGNWKEFKRWEEVYVCDDCMHSDPKYKKLYQK